MRFSLALVILVAGMANHPAALQTAKRADRAEVEKLLRKIAEIINQAMRTSLTGISRRPDHET